MKRVLLLLPLFLILISCTEERDTIRINLISQNLIIFRTELISKELYGTQPPTYSTQYGEQMDVFMYGHKTFELNTDDDFYLYTYFESADYVRIQVELNDEIVVDTLYNATTAEDTLTVKQVGFDITYY
jgi:hypothetical protein